VFIVVLGTGGRGNDIGVEEIGEDGAESEF
jgi:hypothetical protein